jgi:hypothetical protein
MEENEGFRKRVELKAEEAWDAATSFLLGVVKGDSGVEGERLSADTRVRAAKVLKEYTLDKTLADKKDKEVRGQGGSAADLVKALQEIEASRKRELEERAIEAGKLAKISEKVRVMD